MSKTRVDQVRDTYSSDAAQAQRSVREQFTIIVSNFALLEKVDPKGTHEKFLDSITDDVERSIPLQDWQMARVDEIYEKVMKAAGLPSVPRHMDRRRKGINYGHQGK